MHCGFSELVVGIAGMSKMPDLDAFDRRQIISTLRTGHSLSEIIRQLGFSRLAVSTGYQEYMDGEKKKD